MFIEWCGAVLRGRAVAERAHAPMIRRWSLVDVVAPLRRVLRPGVVTLVGPYSGI